jgi:hypothetical protein
MWLAKYVFCVVAALALALGGQAEVIFSNVVIGGTLVDGASYETGFADIDFSFPDAVVGDPPDPRRFGNIIITFEAESDIPLDRDTLSILGALDGSGVIYFNEVVEDHVIPGIIATHNALLDENSDLPYTADLLFERTSTRVKVKKTFFLSAEDTADFDVASVLLVEQKLLPEPSTLLTVVLIGLGVMRRR